MALLEDLIKDIADPRLRIQIATELGKLKARKKFGLVFEEHLPEIVQLPGLAVKPGARVAKRGNRAAGFFVVTAVINGKKVSITPERGGIEEIAAKDDLVVVKRFGEPMYPALVPVGRMVRTPLARRIEDDEFLGSVALFLPHYDEEGLKAIIEKLEDPETGSPVKVERKRDLEVSRRAGDKSDLFAALEKIPTYVLDNTRRQANTRRLLSLARKLTMDGIDGEAWADAKTLTVETLKTEAGRLRKNPEFQAKVSGTAKINVREFKVEFGELRELKETRTIAVEVTPENIDDLFAGCETILGEGIKDEYWRRVS
jgi:hypothetical protein